MSYSTSLKTTAQQESVYDCVCVCLCVCVCIRWGKELGVCLYSSGNSLDSHVSDQLVIIPPVPLNHFRHLVDVAPVWKMSSAVTLRFGWSDRVALVCSKCGRSSVWGLQVGSAHHLRPSAQRPSSTAVRAAGHASDEVSARHSSSRDPLSSHLVCSFLGMP